MIGIGTELHSVKGNQIKFSTVNVCREAIKGYINKLFALFSMHKYVS